MSVRVTAFTGNRPSDRSRTASARPVFWARYVEGLFEDLRFHRLAAEQPFKIADALFQLPDPGRADNVLVGMDGSMTALQHPALPGESWEGEIPARRAT